MHNFNDMATTTQLVFILKYPTLWYGWIVYYLCEINVSSTYFIIPDVVMQTHVRLIALAVEIVHDNSYHIAATRAWKQVIEKYIESVSTVMFCVPWLCVAMLIDKRNVLIDNIH